MIDFCKFSPDDPHDFEGFLKISEVISDNCKMIPAKPGIYIVFSSNRKMPVFCDSFKEFSIDPIPARDLNTLWRNWIEETSILYIGKATNLRNRLKAYIKWGRGKKSALGHKGGRDIWQIQNVDDLLLAWRVEEKENPEIIEKKMLDAFKERFKKYPFANHRR